MTGPSGIGKSTLAATLLGFIPPTAGTIQLVGARATVDAASVDGDERRAAVGWCEQDPHVFDSTVAANLRLAAPSASDEQLRDALRTVRLERWLSELPDGLDTFVGEHGRTMSGGERQRLALARVVLSAARIVVVDEPTEHVDDDMAAALLRDLLHALCHRTVLLITHRGDLVGGLATRIVELTGAPDELVSPIPT